MDEQLVSLEELKAKLEWELSDDEEKAADGALEELSDDARYFGSTNWVSAGVTPRQVLNLIRRAAARWMRNPDGFTQSRAGDETVAWTDRGESSGSACFTEREERILADLAGKSRFVNAPLTAWGPVGPGRSEGWVPTGPNSKPFPYFNSDDGPW